MFRRAVASFCVLIAAMLAAVYVLHIRVLPQDVVSYKNFYNESKELRSRPEFGEKQPAIQYRENVQKEIWVAQGEERIPFRLASDRSELTLIQKKGKVEGVEKMEGIDGWIQEKIDADSSVQEVRRFQAAQGIYLYPSHEFSAQKTQVALYRFPANETLPPLPLITAIADELQFSPQAKDGGQMLTLRGNFQATSPLGRLEAGSAAIDSFDLQEKPYHLHLDRKVKVSDGLSLSISSEKADCAMDDLSLSLIACKELRFEGDVEIKKMQAEQEMTAQGGSAIYKKGFATLYPVPSSLCRVFQGQTEIRSRKIDFDFEKEVVVCELPEGEFAFENFEGPIQFCAERLKGQDKNLTLENNVEIWQDGLFSLEADRGQVSLDPDWSPLLILLDGGVRMLSTRIEGKESFALADSLVYHPADQTAVLSSNAPKKVLFWQEGLKLSASEIKIIQNDNGLGKIPAQIQGIGDVRFSFNLEEEDSIQNLIGKYKGLR